MPSAAVKINVITWRTCFLNKKYMQTSHNDIPADCKRVMPIKGRGEENGFINENSSTLEEIRLDGITSPINKNIPDKDRANVLSVFSRAVKNFHL